MSGNWSYLYANLSRPNSLVIHTSLFLSQVNWGTGEPNGAAGECVELISGNKYGLTWDGKWNDDHCVTDSNFVCEVQGAASSGRFLLFLFLFLLLLLAQNGKNFKRKSRSRKKAKNRKGHNNQSKKKSRTFFSSDFPIGAS